MYIYEPPFKNSRNSQNGVFSEWIQYDRAWKSFQEFSRISRNEKKEDYWMKTGWGQWRKPIEDPN